MSREHITPGAYLIRLVAEINLWDGVRHCLASAPCAPSSVVSEGDCRGACLHDAGTDGTMSRSVDFPQ
jgi:hypothetical protein